MNEQKNVKQRKSKIVTIAIVFVAIMLIGIIYYISKDDLIKASKKDAKYAAKINSNGELVYTYTDNRSGYEHQSSVEDMVKDVESSIGDYMGGTEEQNLKDTQYLIEAEAISKLPYIDDIPKGQLNGNIKFYRYINTEGGITVNQDEITAEDIKEENRLKYKKFDEFNALVEEYKTTANKEVFKYFTIDEEGTVIVAYGYEENRTIETGVESSLRDRDLNVDIIKEKSGQVYSKTAENKFQMAKYDIYTKPIDYESLTSQYVMPANLLYSFLIQTGDIEFVKEIAKLAYDTEIAIGIYDNVNHYNRTETYTYYKMLNMDIETSLDFNDPLVSIKDSSPNIVLKKEDLYSTKYINMPVWCKSTTNENGVIEHELKYLLGGGVPPTARPDYNMFITGTNADNKITNLGKKDSAANITKYTKTTTSMANPSVGILLADTWISRWEITYAKEDLPGSDGTPSDSASLDDANIQEYTDSGSVLGAFEENSKANISQSLTNHAGDLRENLINQVIKNTPESVFTVTPKTIGKNNVSLTKKQQILNSHLNKSNPDGTKGCSDCLGIIAGKGLTNAKTSELINAIEKNDGVLRATKVYDHYTADLNSYISSENWKNKQNAQDLTKERKAEFKEQLNKEGTVSTVQKLSATKEYKDITYVSATISSTTMYKKNDVESGGRDATKDGEKFSKIYNKRTYYVARRKMLENVGWFWDNIRENEDTAKLEELLRYLLYTATNSQAFGEFDGDDKERIAEIFSAFEPKEEMQTAIIGGRELMRDYICAFENEAMMLYLNGESGYTDYVAKYITEDKTMYKVRDDGSKNPTVGFGIDLFNGGYINDFGESISFADELINNHGYTIEQLKDISGATLIPVNIIDDLKEKRLQQDYNKVIAETEHLNLTQYQIYALVSRSFNYNISGFVEAYEAYYDFERDDKYGQSWLEQYFNHPLYTEFMSKPIKSKEGVQPGLITRRKSEWKLFLTGYMDNIDKWASDNSIIECADKIHKYMEQNNYTYCVSFCNDLEECSNISQCGRNVTFEESKTGYHKTCCATYVSWVLQEAGYITRKQHTDSAGTMKNTLIKMGWQQINSIDQANPGDILYYSYGHIEIYAGDGTVYNAGSGNAIRDPSPKIKQSLNSVSIILRAP